MPRNSFSSIAAIARNSLVEDLFPTPILQCMLESVDELNSQLTELILAAERSMPSAVKSNQGGWQSAPDFFGSGAAPISTLERHIGCALEIATARLLAAPGLGMQFDLYGWAAVNRKGHYNTMYLHPMATWSGVYYVDAGDQTPGAPEAVLEFAHPIAAAVMTFFPGQLPTARVVKPAAGMIIVFPSYLQHSVRMYHGDRPRICVAFNAHLRRTHAAGDGP